MRLFERTGQDAAVEYEPPKKALPSIWADGYEWFTWVKRVKKMVY
jgi:hypothetical protein